MSIRKSYHDATTHHTPKWATLSSNPLPIASRALRYLSTSIEGAAGIAIG